MKTNRLRARRIALFLGVAAVVTGVDQLTKFWAEATLISGPIKIIDPLLTFRLAYNDAAAFWLGVGATWVLAILSTIAVVTMVVLSPRIKTSYWAVIGGFVLGGAAGNGIDRVFKDPAFLNGHVVDFIQVPFNFPIFNLADSFLVVGIILVIIQTLRGDQIGGGRDV